MARKKDRKRKNAKRARKEKKARKAEKKAARKARKAVRSAMAVRKVRKVRKVRRVRKVHKATSVKAARKPQARPEASEASERLFRDRRQPESLRLREAAPSLTVADIHKSRDYYRDVLGFTVGERSEEQGELKGVELVAGNVRFWLAQDDWRKGRDRVKGEGFRLYCVTAQDIDAFAARVRLAGGNVVEQPKDQAWGGRDFAVRDPDGYLISFSSRF